MSSRSKPPAAAAAPRKASTDGSRRDAGRRGLAPLAPARAGATVPKPSTRPAPKPSTKRRPTARLPAAERRAQILDKAFDYFSEHGLTAQTRALAAACGVSQRLLYSVFPSKAALIKAVYEADIAGPFKAMWFVLLRDRSKPVERRLNEFYREYYDTILTRSWLRLFLYASLGEVEMAHTYIASIITNLLESIVEEAAHEAGLQATADRALTQELGWALHGSISHLAIRRHIYRNGTAVDVEKVIAMHVACFLSGLKAVLRPADVPRDAATVGPRIARARR